MKIKNKGTLLVLLLVVVLCFARFNILSTVRASVSSDFAVSSDWILSPDWTDSESTLIDDTDTSSDPDDLPSVDSSFLWPYLFNGDFLGFVQAALLSAFGIIDVVYAVIALLFIVPLYLRTKSLLLVCIIWIMLGGFFIALMPAVSGLSVLFLIIGIGGLFYRLFKGRE